VTTTCHTYSTGAEPCQWALHFSFTHSYQAYCPTMQVRRWRNERHMRKVFKDNDHDKCSRAGRHVLSIVPLYKVYKQRHTGGLLIGLWIQTAYVCGDYVCSYNRINGGHIWWNFKGFIRWASDPHKHQRWVWNDCGNCNKSDDIPVTTTL